MKVMRDLPLIVWFIAAIIIAIVHRWVPEATWLMVHLVALGALTHSVMVWSAHFSAALLKTRSDEATTRRANIRLAMLGLGALIVFIGVPTAIWWLTLVGTVAVGAAVVWHGAQLFSDLRKALPGRFRICIRYYVASASLLPVGIGFGAALAWGLGDDWNARLLIAHTMTNLLGWIGLTLVGTLVTFWPTLLRTRMDDRSEKLARQTLPILLLAIAAVDVGALVGIRWISVLGLGIYLFGLLWWGRSLLAPFRRKPPREFAPASVGVAAVWGIVALIATGWHLLSTNDLELADGYPRLASIWVAGFLLQLVTGALSYLIPSVVGGGPRVVRTATAQMDRFATVRLVIINGGLLLWLFPLPSWVQVTVAVLVLAAFASFLVIMVSSARVSAREKARIAAGEEAVVKRPKGPHQRPSAFTGSGLVAGISALVLAVTVGIGADPSAVGYGSSGVAAPEGPVASGETVHIDVIADDMIFIPDSVTINRGDHLVINLVNEDPTNIHDLMIRDARSGRLAPGESVELDAGVFEESTQGWCTIVGHRQMGMVFDVIVEDDGEPTSEASPAPEETATTHDHSETEDKPGAELSHVIDPIAPKPSDETVHEITLEVTEEPLEVAPGVWQQRWTFNGESSAPTLRGRVGDVFKITLVNNGTMGHSIDFHASNLAPDLPMRTIPPGESLEYEFEAKRAGIWMYHCGTDPMTAHIAAGMAGVVIIDPEDGFDDVDREYVLAQSEVYLDTEASDAESATEVDVEKALGDEPDLVVFNGVADQYMQEPFEAKVGEKVRFWVLDVGPNRSSSFHIVGGQFDTVYFEGAYHLRDGEDAFGFAGGGSQALGMHPAEGGFVELTFPEAGHYSVVSHVMGDAERGAMGVVEVTDR